MAPRFWEDLVEGERLPCREVVFDLAEIVSFARQYDPQPFHVDEEAAALSRFGGIIASSMHTLSACLRAMVDAQGEVAILTGLGIEPVQLPSPVRPGDVLTLDAFWAALRRSTSKPDRGTATLRFSAANQRGETVVQSGFTYMIACRTYTAQGW